MEVWGERVSCCAKGKEAGVGWIGLVVRRDEAEILGKTQLVEVPGGSSHLEDQGRLEEKYAIETCKSKLARGACSEQRSVADCHQQSHLVKMSSKDIKRKK